ncbi:CPXCG motif-containing cysteine-rich protein [Robiginitalea sp. M366]|uniref:CPXCG motif-containing cysteine-rich protein n=1 Tax=Robiginitalea aestuariiviva TaxID=3036903 RepID=UPI00240D1F3D|nr:CPXCG motif-containing cysteine-rich protein [Robiginitalea aestuariiviva]MDG1571914.1 CPXCG motif-containing cysteine-rich protein [Robiginitalea aestuariiviva]
MIEHFFQCPYCWESISILVDPSAGDQHYVEDCEVCCNPIDFHMRFASGELIEFQADALGQ